jgi:CRISPR-associated endonuclease Cas3-HD
MYYAHSPKNAIPAQAYEKHVRGVSERSAKYADDIRRYAKLDGELLRRLVKKAAILHDLGKLIKENQAALSREKTAKSLPKNHVDAGTAFFLAEEHLSAICAAVVQAHHLGYPDFIEEQNKGKSILRDVKIMAEIDALLPKLKAIHDSLIDPDPLDFRCTDEEIRGDRSVFLRLLLSCLADADHTDTALNYGNYPEVETEVQLLPAKRLAYLDKYVASLKDGGDERSRLRREMYLACKNSQPGSNICSCGSPVGSGKTTAVMAHLLAQADKCGLRRIFVVLPFTNIIQQSVKTYRKALVLPGETAADVVAELHHRADFENEDARHLTALWRAPIVVTTAVAFFETLAANSPAALRRLHELPGSAVFMDESHAALPATLLPIAWRWMNVFGDEWGCRWALASGSLNRFWDIEEITGAGAAANIPEIVDDDLRIGLSRYEKRRVEYKCDLNPKNPEELANWIVGFAGPRLVIMNTVQNAAVLADLFRERFGRERVEHLSSALTPLDREKTLNGVGERLNAPNDADWTFIATSCVEAGVDLSFRTGFRELASLASMLQAAGRVNRGGEYADAAMWTFCTTEGGLFNANPGLKGAAEILRGYFRNGVDITPDLSTKSISDEIKLYGMSSKHKKLVAAEAEGRFPCVENDFKVIDGDTRVAVVAGNVADGIRRGDIDWRDLQNNSVQIAGYRLVELRMPEIRGGIYHWNLDYDAFLGYMAGMIKLKKAEIGVTM